MFYEISFSHFNFNQFCQFNHFINLEINIDLIKNEKFFSISMKLYKLINTFLSHFAMITKINTAAIPHALSSSYVSVVILYTAAQSIRSYF